LRLAAADVSGVDIEMKIENRQPRRTALRSRRGPLKSDLTTFAFELLRSALSCLPVTAGAAVFQQASKSASSSGATLIEPYTVLPDMTENLDNVLVDELDFTSLKFFHVMISGGGSSPAEFTTPIDSNLPFVS
jgi:hypothetical protein